MLKVKRFNVERAVERPTVLHPEVNHRQHQHGVGDDLGDCGITIHHPEFHHFGDGDGDDNDVGDYGTLPHGSAVKVDHQPLAWVEGN